MISERIVKLSARFKLPMRVMEWFNAIKSTLLPCWFPGHQVQRQLPILMAGIIPLILLLLWHWVAQNEWVSEWRLPSPEKVWETFLALVEAGELVLHFYSSLASTLAGLLAGVVFGVGFAFLLFYFRFASLLFYPLYNAMRQTPIIALTPLFALWVSNSGSSRIIIIALAAFYLMVLHTYEGLRNVDNGYHDLGQIYGFNRWQQFRLLLLPASVPAIVSGLSSAIPFSWLACIGSELLLSSGVNAGIGVGGFIRMAEATEQIDIILVCIFLVTLSAISMNYASTQLGRHLLRWRNPAP